MVSYKCTRCDKQFIQKIDYQRHLNRKTPCPKMIRELECSECNKTFSNKSNLNRHIHNFHPLKIDTNHVKIDRSQSIETIQTYKCCHNLKNKLYNLEGLQYKSQVIGSDESLEDHNLAISESQNNQKVYTCEYCGQVFYRNNNWNRHIKSICKVKKQNLKHEEKEKVFQLLLKKMEDQEKEINKLKQQLAIN